MSSRWGRAALCGLLAFATLPILDGAASADGPAAHVEFALRVTDGPDRTVRYISGDDGMSGSLSEAPRHVQIEAGDETTGRWTFEFAAPRGQILQAGHTYDLARSDVLDGSAARLVVTSYDDHCGGSYSTNTNPRATDSPLSIGQFTVHEIEYDGSWLTAFSATFEHNCQHLGGPSVQGTIAWWASDPAAPLPAPSPTPGPVTGLAVTWKGDAYGLPYMNRTRLTWSYPIGSEAARTYVGPAAREPGALGGGQPGYLEYRGTGRTAAFDLDGTLGDYEFDVVPVNRLGRSGPARHVFIRGTKVRLSATPSHVTLGRSTTLSGTVVQTPDSGQDPRYVSGPPLPGRSLDVFAKPRGSAWNAWTYLRSVVTRANGSYSLTVVPDQNMEYETRLGAERSFLANASTTWVTLVAPRVDLRAAQRSVSRGARVRFTTLRSTRGSRGIVKLQRFDDGTWRTLSTKRIGGPSSARSPRAALAVRAKHRGVQLYRLVNPGDRRHVAGVSRTVKVTVR